MSKLQKIKKYFSYETRKPLRNKFLIILTLLVLYFLFAAWHLGLKDGFLVMILTWSFFVLATPIPDGGIILDLPIRYFIGIKMVFSEIFVWTLAISLNVINLIFNPAIYGQTFLLTLFKDIITTPYPYGIIILLSCIGTFFSLYFGDELYEVISHHQRDKHNKHHQKFKIVMAISIIIFVIIFYKSLLKHLGVKFF